MELRKVGVESRAVAGGRLLLHKTDGRVGRLQMIVQRCDALTHFFKGCDGCLRFGRERHALKRYTLLGAPRCHKDLAGTAPHPREIRRVQIHTWHVAEPGPELAAFPANADRPPQPTRGLTASREPEA